MLPKSCADNLVLILKVGDNGSFINGNVGVLV